MWKKLQTGLSAHTVAKEKITPNDMHSEPLCNWQKTEVSVAGFFQTSWRTEPVK